MNEFRIKGSDYTAVPDGDEGYTIREINGWVEIGYCSDLEDKEQVVYDYLEREGIRIYGELYTPDEIKQLIYDVKFLRAENRRLEERIEEYESDYYED